MDGKHEVVTINKPEATTSIDNTPEVQSSLYVKTNFQSQMMHIMK